MLRAFNSLFQKVFGGDRSEIVSLVAPAVFLLLLWGVFLTHAAPSVTVGDSGEFITSAVTLSLPHAPSYPLYFLAGKCFSTSVFWGNEGYKMNIFSGALNFVTLALVFWLMRGLGGSVAGSVFALLVLAGSPSFFHNGLVTEVFSLNTVFVVLLMTVSFGGGRSGILLSAFLGGLGLGNHHTLLFVFPGIALLLLGRYGREPGIWLRYVPMAFVFFLLGMTIYGVLPLRSAKNPPLDWGNPETARNLYRTVARKDYGSLSLSLGDTPARTFGNTARQVSRFAKDYAHELTLVGCFLVILGAFKGFQGNRWWVMGVLVVWILAGPFFAVLGNLSFDAQSNGIIKRFYILPVVVTIFLAGFGYEFIRRRLFWGSWLLFLLPIFMIRQTSLAFSFRSDFLTQDYSRGILRTLPPGAAFFMDGGDDTFYSMAFQRYVQQQRPDLAIFDRGGLIFRSPYGRDFRSLTKERKEARRVEIEAQWLGRGPLYYSTMDEKILKGVSLGQKGFLFEAGISPTVDRLWMWDLLAQRSLYPPVSHEYRTLALAPYFPYMYAKDLWRTKRTARALSAIGRAWSMAPQVPWVQSNLPLATLEWAYERFSKNDWQGAEDLYRMCLRMDPQRTEAMANMGAIGEKRNDLDAARQWYEKALENDPAHVNSLFNLSVVHWKKGDWPRVVGLMKRVLQLEPEHAGARRFLPQALQRAKKAL